MNLFDSALMKNADVSKPTSDERGRGRGSPSEVAASLEAPDRAHGAGDREGEDRQEQAQADDAELGQRPEVAVVGDARVVDHPVGAVGGARLDDVVDRAGLEVADPDAADGMSEAIRQATVQIVERVSARLTSPSVAASIRSVKRGGASVV